MSDGRIAPMSKLPPPIASVLARMPEKTQARLMEVRDLILTTAEEVEAGSLVETLKWGEPSYLPKTPRTGTTVLMNAVKGSDRDIALYFHCQTTLVDAFRELYPGTFRFEGSRALILDARKKLPKKALAHCIALALTYHRRPRQAQG